MFRFLEKVRYKWRRHRTLVRFVVLKLDEVWRAWEAPKAHASDQPKSGRRRETQAQASQRHGELREKPVEISEECLFS